MIMSPPCALTVEVYTFPCKYIKYKQLVLSRDRTQYREVQFPWGEHLDNSRDYAGEIKAVTEEKLVHPLLGNHLSRSGCHLRWQCQS